MIGRTLSILCSIALFLGVAALIYAAHKAVIVLLLSVFCAYMLEPRSPDCIVSVLVGVSRHPGHRDHAERDGPGA
jgi:hypothetical protein